MHCNEIVNNVRPADFVAKKQKQCLFTFGSVDASSAELFHVDQLLQHHIYSVADPVFRCDENHLKLIFFSQIFDN